MPQGVRTRNRTGCLACRQRRIRCDEQRPSCQRCTTSSKSCSYVPVIPLRDRRMLQGNALPPGQRAPWASANPPTMTSRALVGSTAMDPFDTLPLKMPFKSRELYHYFHQTGSVFAVAPEEPKYDCIALASQDEHSLRSMILIAGIHYSWNTGKMEAYESAFLFHKLESIRIINTWLTSFNSKRFVLCVRQILTICLAEACLGNITAAETHLNGIMALFDSREQTDTASNSIDDIEDELADRYLLLTSCFVLALKSRLEDFILFRATQGIAPNHDPLTLMKTWHELEYGGLVTRLKAMYMFPHFFSLPPANRRPNMIDAVSIIDCLRTITETVDLVHRSPDTEHADQVWNNGGPTRLMLLLVTSHVESLTKDEDNTDNKTRTPTYKEENGRLPSSWSGLAAAAELYMHSVLTIMNAGAPLECRLLYRICLVIKRDLEQTRVDLRENREHQRSSQSQYLWFWKVSTGLVALARSQYQHMTTGMKCSCEVDLEALHAWFRGCAREWSVITEMVEWDIVRRVLVGVAWPATLSKDGEGKDHAMDAWAQGISKSI
ncbi:hypothetical protein BJX70DRAFT_391011 [Aspergillus crustosus]